MHNNKCVQKIDNKVTSKPHLFTTNKDLLISKLLIETVQCVLFTF